MDHEQRSLPNPFDQLVGTWQVERHIEGNNAALIGEVTFSSLFGGRVAQDVWNVPVADAWESEAPIGGFRGTTIHCFGKEDVLHSVWIDTDQVVSLSFTGSMDSTGYVLTSNDAKIRAKWELRLTSATTATWHAYRRQTEGAPWHLWEVMQLNKRAGR